jgi:hypothetical protein
MIALRALENFSIEIHKGEIIPPEVQSWLTRTGRIMELQKQKLVEIGRME